MVKQKQSKWGEIGDDVIKLVSKNWWKVILIILALGISITGFKCSWGAFTINKSAIIKNKTFDKKIIKDNKE